jgi:hypothetical protein
MEHFSSGFPSFHFSPLFYLNSKMKYLATSFGFINTRSVLILIRSILIFREQITLFLPLFYWNSKIKYLATRFGFTSTYSAIILRSISILYQHIICNYHKVNLIPLIYFPSPFPLQIPRRGQDPGGAGQGVPG